MDRKFKIDVEGTEEEKELIRTLTTLFYTGRKPAGRPGVRNRLELHG